MRGVMAAIVVGFVMAGSPVAVHAAPPPVIVTDEVDSYGPGINPSVGVEDPNVNPGDTIRVFGSGFCANTPVIVTISPAVAGFPTTLVTDAEGKVTVTFTAPDALGPYTVTITSPAPVDTASTTASPMRECQGSGFTIVTVEEVDSGGPNPDQGTGQLPATGSNTALLQVRNALVAVAAGLGLVLVAALRRRAAADDAP